MKRVLMSVVVVAVILAPSWQNVVVQADEPQSRTERQRFYPKPNGVPGRYTVRLRDSATGRRGRFSAAAEVASTVAQAHGVSRVRSVYKYALNGFSADMSEQVAQRVSQDPRVEYVAQATRGSVAGTTQQNAPWGLDRIDQETGTDTTYSYENDGSGVTVYVVDTGVRHTHQEFDGRASLGPAFLSEHPGYTSADCTGHGTNVAGIVGGETYGVAKGVDIVSIRVVDCESGGFSTDATDAVDYITQYHSAPAVVNMSVSYEADEALDDAVRNSISAGITYVIAAGNQNSLASNYSPSRVTEAIIVGATTSGDDRWLGGSNGSSNYGAGLDLFAPGDQVPSAYHTSDTATHSYPGATSQAAPHVAGIAARYLGLYPNASPADVEEAIVGGASQVTVGNSVMGYPSPNLIANSEFLDDSPPPPPNTPSCSENDCLLTDDALFAGWDLESQNMQYLLSYQGDGNLVMYDASWNILWASNTNGYSTNRAVMQGDGNFVVYDGNWNAPWTSGTSCHDGAWLIVQNDGNLVIYNANGDPVWDRFGYAESGCGDP